MKKSLFIFTIAAITAVVFVSCKGEPMNAADPGAVQYQDTAGLAEFQQWKLEAFQQWKETQMDAGLANPISGSPKKVTAASSGNTGGYLTNSSTHNAKVEKKKGWSKAAKGAAIGGGSGAVLGALIHKRNRVVGAIVGGIIGGGSGYIIGRSKDKKGGR